MLCFQMNSNLRDIGTNVALALQAYTELEPFMENNQSFFVPSGQQMLDLSAAPILFHLQSDIELMEYIKGCDNNVDNLDSKRVCFMISCTCYSLYHILYIMMWTYVIVMNN